MPTKLRGNAPEGGADVDESNQELLKRVAEEVKDTVGSPRMRAAVALLYTGFVVNRLFNVLNGRYGLRHRTALDVLTALALNDGTLRPSDLSKSTVRSKQVVSHVIDNLERDGLIRGGPIGGDRRTRSVRITKKGLEIVEQQLPRFRYLRDNFASMLSDEESSELLASLRKIRKQIYDVMGGNPPFSGERAKKGSSRRSTSGNGTS